ncbi:MAG: bifunctional metallophosphatase/5'-nucleotidase [Nitrospirota bacterium]
MALRQPLKSLLPVLVAVALGLGAACVQPHPQGEAPRHHLVVLHTNDSHGHPVRFSYSGVPDVGGLPARATLVRKVRAENENVLVLDAGDFNTGRAESTFFKARPDLEGYNAVGYDALTLGNHEFDNPLETLKEQMNLANFPFLSANIKTREGGSLARPYVIKEFKGFRVAILGLTTKETERIGNPDHTKDLLIQDEVAVARRLVPKLRSMADLVIALVHLGIYDSPRRGSRRLASEVAGIDLIVDGHSHTRLDAPLMVKHGASDWTTTIVQAWQWGLVVGRVDLWFGGGRATDFAFEAIPVNLKTGEKGSDGSVKYTLMGEEIREDPVVVATLQGYVSRVDTLLSERVGRTAVALSSKDGRSQETALGDLVADATLWYTRHLQVDFAFQNAGGIRTDLPRGEISRKAIYEVLPFDNTVVVLTLRGSDLEEVFHHIGRLPEGAGGFPQVSDGVSFTINRVTGRCEDIRIQGKPLDPGRTYRIATNSYLAAGGDGYRMFLNAVDRYDSSRFLRDVFADYLKHIGGVVTPAVGRRFTVITNQQGYLPCRLAA